MVTFLKVFFALILLLAGFALVLGSLLFSMFTGSTGTLIGVIIGIAMIAGAITLGIKIRR